MRTAPNCCNSRHHPFFNLCRPVEGALRAGPDASPPLNMHRAIVFQAAIVCSAVATIYTIEGKQTRRVQDEARRRQMEAVGVHGGQNTDGTAPEVVGTDTYDYVPGSRAGRPDGDVETGEFIQSRK